MGRKAKREGKDPSFYLQQGIENPSVEELDALRKMPKEEAFAVWRERHGQHCYEFHFGAGGCHRDRTCSFLHADASFVGNDAVAFG